MNEIATVIPGGALAHYEPRDTPTTQAKADALIAFAKRMHDWPTLEIAVEEKLADQEEFVRWWRDNVRRPGQGNNADLRYFSVSEAEIETGITQQQVSKWSKRLADREKYRASLFGSAWKKAMAEKGQTDLRGASGTGENEWYTPAEHIALARQVLGTIDLDPASSEIANRVVQAEAFFTEADNGLDCDWYGNVWLNPPYAQPAISHFIDKAVAEVASGNVSQMIVLTHNYTDTRWFQTAAQTASAICFSRGRVRFESPTGEKASPTQGQAFFYFGPDVPSFHEHFASIGFVVEVLK